MSKYGKFFIERYIHGVVNFSITQESLKELIIPILSNNFQTQIANIVNQSYELRQQANNLYQEAENILLEELNIKNYKLNNKKFFIKKLSETQQAERIDAEYFQPKYDEIINIISNKQLETLLIPLLPEDKQQQISNKVQESFEKRNYSDKLIDIAKRAVEIAIEEDEDTAAKYIENNL